MNSTINLTLLLCLALASSVSPVLERGGKTYYALPQMDTKRFQEASLWHTHTTTDIGNPFGLSMQVIPFFSTAVRTSGIAKQFTLKESEVIRIASDRFNQKSDSVLPYHAIVHNTAIDAAEKTAALILTPSYSNLGAVFSIFFDAKKYLPGFSLACQVPAYFTTTQLTESGATTTIAKYFAGTYEQASPLQDALAYGLLGRHRYTVCGPLSISIKYNLVENAQNYITAYAGAGFAIKKTPVQTYLFDYHSSVYSHHKLIAGLEAGATLAHDDHYSIELLAQTHYHYFFPGTENRILGLLDDDGSMPVHSSYLSGAERSVKGVFPLANVLHRKAHRDGMHQIDATCIGALNYQNWTINLGYGILGREEERLAVEEWPKNTYAIVSPTYNTAAAFSNAASTGTVDEHVVLLNHRYLTKDMVNPIVAASPAHVVVSLSGSIGCTLELYDFPVGFGAGFNYEHGMTNASPSMITVWLKAFVSF